MELIFVLFLSFGIYLISCDLCHIPTLAATKAVMSITQPKKHHILNIEAIEISLASRLSKIIRLSESRKKEWRSTLAVAEIPMQPETYFARCIVKALLKLLFLIPFSLLAPLMDVIIIICGALDMRILDPSYEDFEGSKVNLAVKTIFKEWQESTPKLGTQMVFCDLSTPHYDGKFNVYDDMKQKLIQLGIPEEQIKFIHDANSEKQKEQLFADMRSGKVRILFGSTSKMGAGTNAQNKIVAIHHLDCPWRPGDVGRILRTFKIKKNVEVTDNGKDNF